MHQRRPAILIPDINLIWCQFCQCSQVFPVRRHQCAEQVAHSASFLVNARLLALVAPIRLWSLDPEPFWMAVHPVIELCLILAVDQSLKGEPPVFLTESMPVFVWTIDRLASHLVDQSSVSLYTIPLARPLD